MDEVITILLIPAVAGTIWVAGLAWWFVSVVAEGYGQAVRMIRSANRGSP